MRKPLTVIAFGLSLAAPAAGGAVQPIPATPPAVAPDLPPVAEVLSATAERRLPRSEIEDLRGGFTSPVDMEITVDFAASVNDTLLDIADGDYLSGYSGVTLGVVDGTANIVGTNDFRGVITQIQNSLDFQDIQTLTRVDIGVSGSLAAFRAGTLTSEISYLRAASM